MSEPWFDVGSIDEVPHGSAAPFSANGRRFVVCNADGALHALAGRCTHAAWPLANAPVEGCELVCTLHGARFDVRSGAPTGLPASKPLRVYPLRVRAGRIEVRVPSPPR